MPINVHPKCVMGELHAEDCMTELEGLEDALRANSKLGAEEVAEVMAIVAAHG